MLFVYYYLLVSKNALYHHYDNFISTAADAQIRTSFGINWIRGVHEYLFPYLWYKYI